MLSEDQLYCVYSRLLQTVTYQKLAPNAWWDSRSGYLCCHHIAWLKSWFYTACNVSDWGLSGSSLSKVNEIYLAPHRPILPRGTQGIPREGETCNPSGVLCVCQNTSDAWGVRRHPAQMPESPQLAPLKCGGAAVLLTSTLSSLCPYLVNH